MGPTAGEAEGTMTDEETMMLEGPGRFADAVLARLQAGSWKEEVRVALSVSHVVADTSEPVLDSTVGETLRRAADAVADGAALVQGVPDHGARRRWTFGELLDDAERVARALLGRFDLGN